MRDSQSSDDPRSVYCRNNPPGGNCVALRLNEAMRPVIEALGKRHVARLKETALVEH